MAKGGSGIFDGTRGNPQGSFDLSGGAGEGSTPKPTYSPSPKHDPVHGWGNPNPIKNQEEGQRLLDTGYRDGRQIYNVTDDGTIIKFQPDGTPENGYHPYVVSEARDVPAAVLRQMVRDGKISKSTASRARRGKL